MKKFLPILFITLVFGSTMVAQMIISGQDLAASKLSKESEKFAHFEKNYQSLTLKTHGGKSYNLKNTKQPIVILNFWASWCRPCLSEFATLKKLVKKYPNDVLVIGINNDEENPAKAIEKTTKDLELNFESVIDLNTKVTEKFEIERIPASIAFHKGKVFHFVNEEFDFMNKEFLEKIDSLLKN